jgi:hypothetical protein
MRRYLEDDRLYRNCAIFQFETSQDATADSSAALGMTAALAAVGIEWRSGLGSCDPTLNAKCAFRMGHPIL